MDARRTVEDLFADSTATVEFVVAQTSDARVTFWAKEGQSGNVVAARLRQMADAFERGDATRVR
jgi:hypothetical protein